MKALALVIVAGCYHDKPVVTPVVTPSADLTDQRGSRRSDHADLDRHVAGAADRDGRRFDVTPINVNNTLRVRRQS